MHMNSLLPNPLQSAMLIGQITPIVALGSGNQTPAPVAKVLRWKDLETAVGTKQAETPGTQTPTMLRIEERTPGSELILDGGDSDIEDLFM